MNHATVARSIAAAGCAAVAALPALCTPASAATPTHLVRPGETMAGIAHTAHTSLAALERANPQIHDPNQIRAGQRLNLPAATPPIRVSTTRATTPTSGTKPACQPTSTVWDGHRRFYDSDTGCYTSPWFTGVHRLMVPFGCTTDQWYPHNPTCPGTEGKHHGIDIDMPAGTTIRSNVDGVAVVRPASMGPAYGTNGLIIRSAGHDYVLGHLRSLTVHNGQHIRVGQVLGASGDSGAETEDGPQLHFEVRPAGGGYLTATNPATYLHLHRVQ